jgi:hypothetical protein
MEQTVCVLLPRRASCCWKVCGDPPAGVNVNIRLKPSDSGLTEWQLYNEAHQWVPVVTGP